MNLELYFSIFGLFCQFFLCPHAESQKNFVFAAAQPFRSGLSSLFLAFGEDDFLYQHGGIRYDKPDSRPLTLAEKTMRYFTKHPEFIAAGIDERYSLRFLPVLPSLDGENQPKQTLNLSLLLGEDYPVHHNLCGHLSAYYLTSDSYPDLKTYFETIAKNREINQTLLENRGTDLKDVIFMVETSKRWRAVPSAIDPASCQKLYETDWDTGYSDMEIALCQLKRWALSDKAVITTAYLDPLAGVMVSPVFLSQNKRHRLVEHWVVLSEIIDGEKMTYVRIYNPFHNREEIYEWGDFYRIWYAYRGYPINLVFEKR